jgi:hypothetical protein
VVCRREEGLGEEETEGFMEVVVTRLRQQAVTATSRRHWFLVEDVTARERGRHEVTWFSKTATLHVMPYCRLTFDSPCELHVIADASCRRSKPQQLPSLERKARESNSEGVLLSSDLRRRLDSGIQEDTSTVPSLT